jgi:hypothetical protein
MKRGIQRRTASAVSIFAMVFCSPVPMGLAAAFGGTDAMRTRMAKYRLLFEQQSLDRRMSRLVVHIRSSEISEVVLY